MINILAPEARAEAVAHAAWIACVCELAGMPDRAVELLERGFDQRRVIDDLWPQVHGTPRHGTGAPWRTLFTGDWSLNDPDLDEVQL